MNEKITLKPRINKLNGQVSFNLKKNSLPITMKNKLPTLKGIKVDLKDFEW
jgi:hypothetical protein